MKFDYIIGNPPYQVSDGGAGASATPVYQDFFDEAKKLNPRAIDLITPSKWFAGGKGLDSFRAEMLNDHHLVKIVDFVNAKDCFPNASIGGGVNYFLWSGLKKSETCEFTNIHDGRKSTVSRDLSEFPVLVRYNESVDILHKVLKTNPSLISETVYSRNSFGLPSSVRGTKEKKSADDCIVYSSGGYGYVPFNSITKGEELINKHKVIISKVTSEHAGEPDKNGKFTVVSTVKVLQPGEVCTDSYLVAYASLSKDKAENFARYVCTKFFRFLLLQAISSINLSKDKFKFVPIVDLNQHWTDEMLYKHFGLSEDESKFINNMMKKKEMS